MISLISINKKTYKKKFKYFACLKLNWSNHRAKHQVPVYLSSGRVHNDRHIFLSIFDEFNLFVGSARDKNWFDPLSKPKVAYERPLK